MELYAHGAHFALQLKTDCNPQILRSYFDARTAHWPHPYQHGDGPFTVGTFDDLDLKPHQAFGLISPAVDIVLSQRLPHLIATAGALLTTIVRASDTSEMPPHLDVKWSELTKHLNEAAQNGEAYNTITIDFLCRWYRRQLTIGCS